MIPVSVLSSISEALKLLPAKMDTPQARVMMYAIGLQESRFAYRYQVSNVPGQKGPARGFWQFEKGGGCKGVVNHDASKFWMHSVCDARGVPFTAGDIWLAIENDDVLAACAARLLLFTDGARLPALDDMDGAWDCYVRNWRPGKPHRDTWNKLYLEARATL